MSSSAFASHQPVPITPSRWLCAWIIGVTVPAIVLAAVYAPLWAAIPAGLLCVGAAAHRMRRDALLRAPDSIVALRFTGAGIGWLYRNGEWSEEEGRRVLASSFVSRWLCVVATSAAGSRRRYIVLMPDSLPEGVARQIRVWLTWSRDSDRSINYFT